MWTEEDDAYMMQHFPATPDAVLAEQLGRSLPSVKMRARKLKLRKAADYQQPGRIQPGDKPWNAGLKGLVIKGTEKSQFKSGNMPASAIALAYYDGQVLPKKHVKDSCHYNYRRVAKGEWVRNNRYEWEKVNGPIPRGMLLRCKTVDTLNDDPSNWELMTRKEHGVLNQVGTSNTPAVRMTPGFLAGSLTRGQPELRPLVRAHTDLLEAQRLRITLNRTITHVLETQAR